MNPSDDKMRSAVYCPIHDITVEVEEIPGEDRPWLVDNASWPKGRWILEYSKEEDTYRIKTEYGELVAQIGSTLVAFCMVRTHNFYYEEHKRLR